MDCPEIPFCLAFVSTCINILLTDLPVIVITRAKLSSLEKSSLRQQAPGRFEHQEFYLSCITVWMLLKSLKFFSHRMKVYCIKILFLLHT